MLLLIIFSFSRWNSCSVITPLSFKTPSFSNISKFVISLKCIFSLSIQVVGCQTNAKISAIITDGVYKEKNNQFEQKKAQLENSIREMAEPDDSLDKAIDNVLNFSQNSFEIFKSSQIEEKRRILNFVFENFFMDGKNVEISMHKHFKLLSKIGACQDWCPGEDSNFHCLRQHAPEACASTNFATRASITDILLSHFKINCKHLFQKIIKISIRI